MTDTANGSNFLRIPTKISKLFRALAFDIARSERIPNPKSRRIVYRQKVIQQTFLNPGIVVGQILNDIFANLG